MVVSKIGGADEGVGNSEKRDGVPAAEIGGNGGG